MPNLANPDASPPTSPGEINTQPGIIINAILVAVLSDIVVGLRLITRKWIVKSVGWDDWTIIGAALGITIGCALVLVEVHYGLGRHKSDLPPEAFLEFTRYAYGEWIQIFATLMFTKISICLFLLRIVVSKASIRFLQLLVAALVVSNIILTIIWILQCRPVYLAWTAPKTPLSCFPQPELQKIILAQALISIVSDFVLAAYPILVFRNVQMALRVKVGLCLLMGLGVITGSLCIVRTVGNWQNVNDDPTWNSVVNFYWRNWEVCVGVVAASIPALRPGWKSLRIKLRSYRRIYSNEDTSAKKQSEKSTRPGHVENLGSSATVGAALRPDRVRGQANVTADGTTTEAEVQFPAHAFGIMKTTEVDLESQRTHSETSGYSRGEVEQRDHQAELNGTGRLM